MPVAGSDLKPSVFCIQGSKQTDMLLLSPMSLHALFSILDLALRRLFHTYNAANVYEVLSAKMVPYLAFKTCDAYKPCGFARIFHTDLDSAHILLSLTLIKPIPPCCFGRYKVCRLVGLK